MKWFKRRAPVVVVRDDALANYFKEERQRKENEKLKEGVGAFIAGYKENKKSKFEEDKATLESSVEQYLSHALIEFNKKWGFVIMKSSSKEEKDLYFHLISLWIVNLKLEGMSLLKGTGHSRPDLVNERWKWKMKMISTGKDYKDFWNTERYDELVRDFKKHMEENVNRYGEILFDYHGRDSDERKWNEEQRQIKIKQMEEEVLRKAVDNFFEDLAEVKRGMDYEEKKRKKKERNDRLRNSIPIIIGVILGWGLSVLEKWLVKLFYWIGYWIAKLFE